MNTETLELANKIKSLFFCQQPENWMLAKELLCSLWDDLSPYFPFFKDTDDVINFAGVPVDLGFNIEETVYYGNNFKYNNNITTLSDWVECFSVPMKVSNYAISFEKSRGITSLIKNINNKIGETCKLKILNIETVNSTQIKEYIEDLPENFFATAIKNDIRILRQKKLIERCEQFSFQYMCYYYFKDTNKYPFKRIPPCLNTESLANLKVVLEKYPFFNLNLSLSFSERGDRFGTKYRVFFDTENTDVSWKALTENIETYLKSKK